MINKTASWFCKKGKVNKVDNHSVCMMEEKKKGKKRMCNDRDVRRDLFKYEEMLK